MYLKNIDLTTLSHVEVGASAPKAQMNALGGFIEIRMDGANGKLLGKSDFVGDGGFGAKPFMINLEPTQGKHNLYFVFTAADPKASGALMVVLNTTFKSNASTVGAKGTITTSDLKAFVGKYKMTGLPFEYITISVDDGKLMMDANGQNGALASTGPDTFDSGGKAIIRFLRDDKKVVTKLKMDAMGFSFEGIKE